jgi:hypothetical protein
MKLLHKIALFALFLSPILSALSFDTELEDPHSIQVKGIPAFVSNPTVQKNLKTVALVGCLAGPPVVVTGTFLGYAGPHILFLGATATYILGRHIGSIIESRVLKFLNRP